MATIPSFSAYDLGLPRSREQDETTEQLTVVIDEFRDTLPDNPNKKLGIIICASLAPFAQQGVLRVEQDWVNVDQLTQDAVVSVYHTLVRSGDGNNTTTKKVRPLAENPRGYTYVTGVRTAISFRRRQQRELPIPITDLSFEESLGLTAVESSEETVLSETSSQEIVAIIDYALTSQKKALLQMIMDDRSYRDISKELGIPIGSIGPWFGRIKKTIAERLHAQGYEVPERYRPKPRTIAA